MEILKSIALLYGLIVWFYLTQFISKSISKLLYELFRNYKSKNSNKR